MKRFPLLFLLLVLFCWQCEPSIDYKPMTIAEAYQQLEAGKQAPRYVEIEGYLSVPWFIYHQDGGTYMWFRGTPESYKPIIVSIPMNHDVNAVIQEGGFADSAMTIALNDSSIISFKEKVKLRGEVLQGIMRPTDYPVVYLVSVKEILKGN